VWAVGWQGAQDVKRSERPRPVSAGAAAGNHARGYDMKPLTFRPTPSGELVVVSGVVCPAPWLRGCPRCVRTRCLVVDLSGPSRAYIVDGTRRDLAFAELGVREVRPGTQSGGVVSGVAGGRFGALETSL